MVQKLNGIGNATDVAGYDADAEINGGNRTDAESDIDNTETIPFATAVREIDQITGRETCDRLRVGELAAKVQKKYGENTLAKLAEKTGYVVNTLERRRSVYQAYKDWTYLKDPKPARGPVLYSAMRALQDHPDRFTLLEANPKMTQDQAVAIMQQWRIPTESAAHSDADDLTPTPEASTPASGAATSAPTARAATSTRTRGRTNNRNGQDEEWATDDRAWERAVVKVNNAIDELTAFRERCKPEQWRNLFRNVEPTLGAEMQRRGEAWQEVGRALAEQEEKEPDAPILQGRTRTTPRRAAKSVH